jgi:putative Mg2+ transporter-C (MgtC) family protein
MDMFDGMFERESLMTALEIMIKLGIGAILGGLIGLEREVQGRPAGVRTHMLMVIGVILIGEASKMFGGGDPTRIAAQIVTGVGFLGAGTIMRTGSDVKGLTTAASIWAAAAIGMAVSAGGPLLLVAVAATVLVLTTLALVDDLSRRLSKKGRMKNLVVSLKNRGAVGELLEAVYSAGGQVNDMHFTGQGEDVHVTLKVRGDRRTVLEAACRVEGVDSASWSG